MEGAMEKVRSLMSCAAVPQHYDKVYKDECAYTFDTPYSDKGLCVNLKSWHGVSADMVDLDVQRSGGKGCLYLVQKFLRVEREKPADGAEDPTRLAIGVPGGFLEDKWDVVKEHSLLAVDAAGARATVPLPCPDLPMIVGNACDAVIAHQGAKSMDDLSRWEQDQELKESKYAKDLLQLPATKKISPRPQDWKCEVSGDTQNLWLNLSDGHIGGGRRFWDGSGGSNGALDHFNEEKARNNFFPLVVKLGTITPQGADVYSYAPDEDNMVKDPYLAKHLEHWGIDVMGMDKTDKTLAEMEVDKNLSYDWSRICESGDRPLVRLRGPGLVGLKNLGNSCYMNSAIQMLVAVPELRERYLDEGLQIRSRGPPPEQPQDLLSQTAKLASGLCGSRYAPPWKDGDDEDDPRLLVAPQMFRALISKNHPEFASGRQQDAGEFLQYFLEQLARSERSVLGSGLLPGGDKPLGDVFAFAVEERLQESAGARRVKYSRVEQNILGLPVKLEDAENLAEIAAYASSKADGEKGAKKAKTEGDPEEPKPVIQPGQCLARFAAPEDGIEFRGSAASKTTRIATMPRCLLVQVQRYYVDERWCPAKLDCRLPMPDTLDLESFRGSGVKPGEVEMPEDAAPAGPQADAAIVAGLLSMGLSEAAAKRACLAVQNAGVEPAISWHFEHQDDPEPSDPAPGAGAPDADPEAVAMLASLGFSGPHAAAALGACGNNSERAADWLFSHADDLDGAVAALGGAGGAGGGTAAGGPAAQHDDGVGKYTLMGFISHMGKNTSHGHYVCHMKRGPDGGWVIFDDQKVAKSEAPPLDLGYIYLYRRDDAQ
mmetsp:Transcript_68344/g.192737  ORF Transcript_68344/g.192737 Transcript_68344/m.192737 type:complete len:826 (+) Transcript_68344:80-2557(+)